MKVSKIIATLKSGQTAGVRSAYANAAFATQAAGTVREFSAGVASAKADTANAKAAKKAIAAGAEVATLRSKAFAAGVASAEDLLRDHLPEGTAIRPSADQVSRYNAAVAALLPAEGKAEGKAEGNAQTTIGAVG